MSNLSKKDESAPAFTIDAAGCIIIFVTREFSVAQLCILDGTWQERPENIAIFEEGGGRGILYVVVEVAGEANGRDALAREMIETAHREYAASRGSITLALSQAIRAANSFFYNVNVNTPREARRIAGMIAAVLRGNDLFITQAGPGLACHLRGNGLRRYPADSPWFAPDAAIGDFPTPGTVPLGLRRECVPDLAHIVPEPGDTILLSTRALAYLSTDDELIDAVANRHPDEIIENLEDLTGTADLSLIALGFEGEEAARIAPTLPSRKQEQIVDIRQAPPPRNASRADAAPRDDLRPSPLPLARAGRRGEGERPAPAVPTKEQQALLRMRAERARARRANFSAAFLAVIAGALRGVAGIFARVDWSGIGAAIDGVISAALRGLLRFVAFWTRAFLPGEPRDDKAVPKVIPDARTAWRLAAILFPLLVIAAGGGAWFNYREEAQRIQTAQINQLVDQANAALESAKNFSKTDKAAARDAAQKALSLAQQASNINHNSAAARNALYQIQDFLDTLNGVLLFPFSPAFANYTDARANPSRILSHLPDVFVLDRGTQRIYRYRVDDAGSSAAPLSGDGVILKAGDKIGERPVGELIDMLWIDAGRLVAVDRSGAFLQYDPGRSAWSARAASDAAQWARVNLASSYVGNLYLIDPPRNQILKYVAAGDGLWTSAVTYFAPGVNVDMAGVVDLAIDGDVWVLRGDGAIWRFSSGRLTNFTLRDPGTPLAKPTAIFTSQALATLYVADAGNQRIVQFDKVTGEFVRELKPRSQDRDAFNALKALGVDEANKKIFFINGSQAYLATIRQ